MTPNLQAKLNQRLHDRLAANPDLIPAFHDVIREILLPYLDRHKRANGGERPDDMHARIEQDDLLLRRFMDAVKPLTTEPGTAEQIQALLAEELAAMVRDGDAVEVIGPDGQKTYAEPDLVIHADDPSQTHEMVCSATFMHYPQYPFFLILTQDGKAIPEAGKPGGGALIGTFTVERGGLTDLLNSPLLDTHIEHRSVLVFAFAARKDRKTFKNKMRSFVRLGYRIAEELTLPMNEAEA